MKDGFSLHEAHRKFVKESAMKAVQKLLSQDVTTFTLHPDDTNEKEDVDFALGQAWRAGAVAFFALGLLKLPSPCGLRAGAARSLPGFEPLRDGLGRAQAGC